MAPTIGRILHYRLTADDVKRIEEVHLVNWTPGKVVGNPHQEGQVLPLIVAVVWPNEYGPDFDGVNGQVVLDGALSLWVTSVKEGTEPGMWQWPPRA